jgi:PAS domain S-box-containing protein
VYGQRRSGAVQQHLDTWQHPHSGQVTGQNLLADAPQISVFQRLDQLPATLVVDMPLAELRAAWWRRVRMPLLLAGVLAVAGALAYRRLRRSQQAWDAERVAASNALGSALVQLTRSEERLLAELNEQTDVICRLSADNRVLFVNDAYCRVFNLQRSEHVGGSWHSVALAEDIPAIERQLASLSPANPIVTVDNRVHTAAGVRWFQWINRAQFDAQGRLLTIQGVGRDIDERKALEAALAHNVQDLHRAQQQATELLREQAALLDNELIGIVKLKHRRFEWANRGMARIFGHDPAALVGQSTRLVFCDDASFERMGRSYDQLRNGQPVRVQLQMAHRDGRAVWIDGSGVALNAEGSEALWLMADIDQLKQAEALRLRAGALVAETRQMQQSNQLRTLFLANMSHELRTPLNAVIGFAQLLQGGRVTPDSPQYPGYVNRIASSGQHLLRLIDAVLDVVKLESGQMSFHATPVNLPVLLAEVQQMLAGDISARQVTVVVDTDNAPTDLVADPWRLQQVVFEYLANAVKFSHPGGWVSVNVQAEGRAQLRIEVADSGPGISEADRARLFTDFQQLGTGLNKPHPGLGLGLSLVRRLVEAQGGSVGVRSLPGQGSVFHVVLPLRPRVMTEPDGPGDGAPASPA